MQTSCGQKQVGSHLGLEGTVAMLLACAAKHPLTAPKAAANAGCECSAQRCRFQVTGSPHLHLHKCCAQVMRSTAGLPAQDSASHLRHTFGQPVADPALHMVLAWLLNQFKHLACRRKAQATGRSPLGICLAAFVQQKPVSLCRPRAQGSCQLHCLMM